MLSIQEIVKLTGISARTLRYYDEINLLPPAAKTEGGHRLYHQKDLQKLQEIQFLQGIGFSLKDIKKMLTESHGDWAVGLKNQLTYIEKEKKRLTEIEETLKGLINILKVDGKIDIIEIKKLLQLYQNNQKKQQIYKEVHFNQEERELLKRLPNINDNDPDTLEWISLLSEFKKQIHKEADDPEIQNIVHQIYEKSYKVFGDNDEFFDKFWEIRKSPKASEEMGLYPIDAKFLELFEEASYIYETNHECFKQGKEK